MRHLILKNKQHQHLEQAFKHWLETLSYNTFSIENSPIYVREFLHWLENAGRTIAQVNETIVLNYFEDYLSKRSNQQRGGGLSNDYLNTHLTSIKQFSTYLQQSNGRGFLVLKEHYPYTRKETILTRDQITTLYEATGNDMIFGLRDRAVLGLYYGCGLRRNEGVHVNVKDVLLSHKILHVREGKQYRERYVSLAKHIQEDFENYLTIGRPLLRNHDTEPAFLLSRHGKRLSGDRVLKRIQELGLKAGIPVDFGVHTLRHSIATHLLQAGMSLEQVGSFLGHKCLESTQRYTHIAARYEHQERTRAIYSITE